MAEHTRPPRRLDRSVVILGVLVLITLVAAFSSIRTTASTECRSATNG